jgi:hypothetical protein
MNENQTDKLRIQIYQSSNLKVVLGKKDLPLTLLPRKISTNDNEINFATNTGGGNSINPMFNSNNFMPSSQLNQKGIFCNNNNIFIIKHFFFL